MSQSWKTAREIFNQWAQDTHADGMEKSHRRNVEQAFKLIPESNGNYLEIGTGNGYGIERMAKAQYLRGRCYGLDISPEMIRISKTRLSHFENVCLDAGDFMEWQPEKSLRFTCIFSMEVFYYFSDIQAGIEKAVSLLKPNGFLFVLVNFYKENEASHSWPEDLKVPMALWSAKDYADGFKRAGLKSIRQIQLNDPSGKEPTLCTIGKAP